MPVIHKTDVLIVGAGICGLSAALKLLEKGKSVCILEAGARVGGRIETIQNKFGMPLESGAEFVHGDLPLTKKLAKLSGNDLITQEDQFYSSDETGLEKANELITDQSSVHKKLKELKEDMPLSVFMEKYLSGEEFEEARRSLKRMAESFEVGESERLSTFYFREELKEVSREKMSRLGKGYGTLVQFLYEEVLAKGGIVILNTEVNEVVRQNGLVNAKCRNKKTYKADKIIVTVPIGILIAVPGTKGHINFDPPVPEHIAAAKKIGYGPVVKVSLQFQSCLWKDENFAEELEQAKDLGFILAEGKFPVWWTQKKDLPIITGWAGGPNARLMKFANEEDVLETALHALALILKTSEKLLRENLSAWHVSNWGARPFFEGAYSYNTPESYEARKILNTDVDNMLFFAGEALNETNEIGTVESALKSAEQVVKKLLK
jgi:monoamine oxidase